MRRLRREPSEHPLRRNVDHKSVNGVSRALSSLRVPGSRNGAYRGPNDGRCWTGPLAHRNMVEAFSSLAQHHPGCLLRRAGGVVVAATGSPVALFNEILPVEDAVAAGALIEAVEEVQAVGLSFLVQLREGVDDRLLPVMEDLGLDRGGAQAARLHLYLARGGKALDLSISVRCPIGQKRCPPSAVGGGPSRSRRPARLPRGARRCPAVATRAAARATRSRAPT